MISSIDCLISNMDYLISHMGCLISNMIDWYQTWIDIDWYQTWLAWFQAWIQFWICDFDQNKQKILVNFGIKQNVDNCVNEIFIQIQNVGFAIWSKFKFFLFGFGQNKNWIIS